MVTFEPFSLSSIFFDLELPVAPVSLSLSVVCSLRSVLSGSVESVSLELARGPRGVDLAGLRD